MQRSDEAAYREYVTLRMDVLRRTAFLLCHDWHTADDLVATALARLYDKWKRAAQADNIDAYVRAMLVNVYLDERRRPWRREVSTDRMPEVPAAEVAAAGEHQDLLALVRSLPKKRRAVIVLRFYLDHSVEETAEMLGISTGTVKSQTARGLETLRAAISNVSGVQ
ncbi:SigE family RNA polymerase sigma factor [Dactylosporangium sp. NPDC051541]|uniref:SigE family RNA polymerase sigma factor n=1 Tax=Dactylosporangium sp. NPDC051541 TaxID=3363977 RepID=UPI0037A207E1